MSLDTTDFPKHWSIVPIESVVFFQEGPGVRKHQYMDSGVKLLNGGNINDGVLDLNTTDRYVSEEEAFGKYNHFLVEAGDLLIACSGVIVEKFDGKIAYAREEHLPLCMNTSTMRFRTLNEEVLYIDYFRRFLQTNFFKKQLQKLITGSAQLNFGPSHIKQMFIPLPPLPEQKRIAAILDKADAIRRKRQQAIQLADEFLRSVFLELFGDPVTNPKGWEVMPLSSGIDSITSGWSAKGESYPCKQDELGVLKISAVTSGKFKPEENKFVYRSDIPNNKKLVFPKAGDLIFSRANTRELVAATCIVPKDAENVFLPDKLWIIETKRDFILPEFLNYLIWQPKFKETLTSQATGTSGSMLNISKRKFEDTEAIFPPITLQGNFSNIYRKTQEVLDAFEYSGNDLLDTFSSLSQKAFAGEL